MYFLLVKGIINDSFEFPSDYRVAFIPLKPVASTGISTVGKGLIFSFFRDRGQVCI